MGSPPTLDPSPTRAPATDRQVPDGPVELLEHLQTPASRGGHEFAGQPVHQLADRLGGDLSTLHDSRKPSRPRASEIGAPDADPILPDPADSPDPAVPAQEPALHLLGGIWTTSPTCGFQLTRARTQER
jgi:hypothetical protein